MHNDARLLCHKIVFNISALEHGFLQCIALLLYLQSLRREYDQEVRQIGELKKALEAESAARNEFEAKYKNVKKEMDFQAKLYKEVSLKRML